ncbi:bifunctional DNA primase/polymerase [Streptomyces sp. ACA25]|uniref:bifunctional DNA primase/polymerase n=1 Tax=Streptomyces sp. ACA25 TaxID=3022596 RepID=UPI0023080A37|nr:bifunctional DNA primase/polymerase [Streptomyces sp. ACA25]MDB1086157.1 bifunctional DNA primase/polymerase [Streptomyces sp. ACA25]
MRETLGKLGKRRSLLARLLAVASPGRPKAARNAALTCAASWGWPVVPGVETRPDGSCGCSRPGCVVPGAHPSIPGLLAATTDPRMVRWWWTQWPQAPLLMATGGRAPCALSLPAAAGAWALSELDRRGVHTGPVVATPTRFLLLVAPYGLPELGELLHARDRVPSALRFHGEGGYALLPSSPPGGGAGVRWERPPVPSQGGIALPSAADLLDVAIEAGLNTPDTGSRLAY